MNITELRQERDNRKYLLQVERNVLAYADRRIAELSPESKEYAAAQVAKSITENAIANAEKDLQRASDALAAMEVAARSGQEIEAVEQSTVEAIRYATVVVGIGHDPDRPDQLFAQMARQRNKKPVCPAEVASMLRQLATDLEAKYPEHSDHSDKDHD